MICWGANRVILSRPLETDPTKAGPSTDPADDVRPRKSDGPV